MRGDVGNTAASREAYHGDHEQADETRTAAPRPVVRIEDLSVVQLVAIVGCRVQVIGSRVHWTHLLARGQALPLILNGNDTQQRSGRVPCECRDAGLHNAVMQHFTTARLIARDWTAADLDAAFAIYGRDEVARWLGPAPRQPVSSLAQMRERLDRLITRNLEQPDYGLWALELRASSEVAGAVLLSPLPGDGAPVEIGWHLNPDYWGAGFATEAGRGAIALAFGLDMVADDQLGPELASRPARPVLDRVEAVVDPDNVRSLNVCRRLGMRHRGQTSQYYGLTLEHFELTRAEMG
jgi:RimJ/RimL family protein N-acetyltransferase